MNRDDQEYEDDIDDEYEIVEPEDDTTEDEDDDILADGQSVRVPLMMMDSDTQAIAAGLAAKYPPRHTADSVTQLDSHRPGWRTPPTAGTQDQIVADAHREYVKYLRDAHKTPSLPHGSDLPKPKRPRSLADSRAAADAAYEERNEWLRNAHKERPKRRKPGVQLPYGWAFGDQPNGT